MNRAVSIVLFFLSCSMLCADNPLILPLWPQDQLPKLQNSQPETVTERGNLGRHNRLIRNVTVPELIVYLAPAAQRNGTAVISFPGGGYGGLAIDKEGHDIARWLGSVGVTTIILKYRMPHPELAGAAKPWPLLDAEQAIRLVRSHAAEWNLKQIGIMGFSAGGHLASTLGTHWEKGNKKAAVPLERLSTRPDFMILIYPVVSFKSAPHTGSLRNLLGPNPDPKLIDEYSNELHVNSKTPPTFLIHAKDDKVQVENSLLFHAALKKHRVPCELHLFTQGGHGFGLGVEGGQVATWPALCVQWMRSRGLIPR